MTARDSAAARLHRSRARMAEMEVPALLVTNIDNVQWLTGFSGSSGFVLLTPSSAIFATDSRYLEQAKSECPGYEVRLLPTSAPEEVAAILSDAGAAQIGFEAAHLTFKLHENYQEKLGDSARLIPTENLVDALRLVKDSDEIALIEEACALADRAFAHILPFLRPGAVERDVMLELEWFIRKEGRAEIPFDSIVASGPRSALPHGRASEKVMQRGELVTLDFGARTGGYCSDITRTVVLGRADDEQRRVYGIVLEAQERALEAIRPGASGRDVDAAARSFIAESGHGAHFGHGLGHALGRSVHDGPAFSIRSEVILAEGMVATVEPGIYIPGWGGVRIEDDIAVTAEGYRVLTHAPKQLLEL